MRAVLYERFGERPELVTVPDPSPPRDGVVVEVQASGVCRSDWHGWRGHDPDITLPHVPGHELVGVIRSAGADVRAFAPGDRVTVPFVSGCGTCAWCRTGDPQVCPDQTQPGFTHWGSFAQYVVLRHADHNLVAVPEGLDAAAIASLGCRFATAFRAVVDQGAVRGGQWVAVHGCGGVGLSAVMVAAAIGARVVAVDVAPDALALAVELGAEVAIDASGEVDVAGAVREATGGGAHVSLDALGHPTTCTNSIEGLRRRGRHLQVGLLVGEHARTPLPMDRVLAHELEVVGCHGVAAHRYDAILAMVAAGTLRPERLVRQTVSLQESIDVLTAMDAVGPAGVTVVTSF